MNALVRTALLAWIAHVLTLLAPTVAAAQVNPIDMAEDAVREELSEEDAGAARRLAALEAKQGKRKARVVVLPWPESDTTYRNVLLQELVRSRIGRPNAKFYPSIDLYQEGRRLGRPQPALDQPATISGAKLDELRRRADSLARGVRSADDLVSAQRLFELADQIWFVDRPEIRELLFDVYIAIARATEHPSNQVAPYYRMVGANNTNYGLYLAAAMLVEEEELGLTNLAARMPRGDLGESLRTKMEDIKDRIHPMIDLAFHDGGLFDAERFAREYRVVVNGLERVVDDSGVVRVPRGRVDISLERGDGSFSLSERLEVVRLDDKVYFPIEVARQKMGFELLDRLMDFPDVCTPALSEDTLRTLATYQALHPMDEVYLVVPKLGSVYDLHIWLWDPASACACAQKAPPARRKRAPWRTGPPTDGMAGDLRQLVDRNRGFPVRFAALLSTGMIFNGATFSQDQADALLDVQPDQAADAVGGINTDTFTNLIQMQAAGLPIDFQLRAHFNRLMIGVGGQFAKNLAVAEGSVWRERYQVDEGHLVVSQEAAEDLTDPTPGALAEVYRERQWNRLLYLELGVFLLKDATYGIGPRGYLRWGWNNLPNAWDLSAHVGFTEDPTFGKKEYKGRVVPLIDLDLFAGLLLPFGDTLARNPETGKARVMPQLGFTLGTGFSF